MSFVTGTGVEVLYQSIKAGTAKASFTTEAVINDVAGMGPQAFIPPFFWGNLPYANGKVIRVVARGIMSSTATPTYQINCRLGGAAAITGPIVLGSPAAITASGITNRLWEFEGDVVMTALGAPGANSTVQGLGQLSCGGLAGTADLFAGGASPGNVATVDSTIANYVNMTAACSANAAGNSIQLLQLLVLGYN